VIEAENGQEALKKLEHTPQIKLVLSDYDMPEMDGFTLCFKIRERFQNKVAIIGISSADSPLMAARFIKNGANDFITKQSFITEEFYGRVTQCVNSVFQLEQIQEASVRDFMTNLHNRRYFFDRGKNLVADACQKNLTVISAMIDIDHFKTINDTWGHDTGDQVICTVSDIIRDNIPKKNIVARLGGEEFGVLLINMNSTDTGKLFEKIREQVEKKKIHSCNGDIIQCTISIGITLTKGKNFEDILRFSDELLYQAKNSGRNTVIIKDQQ
jgi:diguanylate cyclase (GGDEF)-like protein